MDRICRQALSDMEDFVALLASQVPQPQLVTVAKVRAFHHLEKTIYQAIVEKLARMVRTLDAARILLNTVVQSVHVAALHRLPRDADACSAFGAVSPQKRYPMHGTFAPSHPTQSWGIMRLHRHGRRPEGRAFAPGD